jgi:hypothetical protein
MVDFDRDASAIDSNGWPFPAKLIIGPSAYFSADAWLVRVEK